MKTATLAWLILALGGCETVSPTLQADIEKSTPVCKTPKSCEMGWAAARRWVNENAGYKIQTYSPEYLETYTAADSASLSVQVSKEPRSDGSYVITAVIGCTNMFGCVPASGPALLQFNTAVSAAIANAEGSAP